VLFRSQKAAAIAASCNILPMNQDLFQVGRVVADRGRGVQQCRSEHVTLTVTFTVFVTVTWYWKT
jgi:hypothetical protein